MAPCGPRKFLIFWCHEVMPWEPDHCPHGPNHLSCQYYCPDPYDGSYQQSRFSKRQQGLGDLPEELFHWETSLSLHWGVSVCADLQLAFFCVVYFSNRLKHQEKYNIVNIKVVQSMVTVLPYIDMYLYTRTREHARERESYIWTLNFLFYCCIFPNGRRFSFQN